MWEPYSVKRERAHMQAQVLIMVMRVKSVQLCYNLRGKIYDIEDNARQSSSVTLLASASRSAVAAFACV